MAAANTDNFLKTRRTFSTQIGAGGVADAVVTTVPLASTTNLPTDTAVCVTINRIDSNGNVTNNSETIVGVVSGTNLVNCVRGVEGTAQLWGAGKVVELLWCETNVNRMLTALLVEHNQSGTHNISATSMIGQYLADAGSANTISGALSPAITSYVTGMKVRIKVAATNTGATTINLNSLGTKAVKKLDGATALVGGELIAGQVYIFVYDGTNFQLVTGVDILFSSFFANFIASGLTIPTSGSLASTSVLGVAYYGGARYPVASDGGHTYTASNDCYVDVNPATGAYTYNTVANGAAAPALTASSIRIAKVVTNGSAVTSVLQDGSLDSLGNVIYPSKPAATLNGTETLRNKRRIRRVVTITQSATPAINTDNTDVAVITGLAQAITSFTTNLTGTPSDGDLLEIDITDNGTARALTFGASFKATTVALPTTTVISTKLNILFKWSTADSAWLCVATA